MGSFNVSCSLSGVSIAAGDPAVLVPLKPNGYFSAYWDGVGKRGEQFLDVPFKVPFFPLFGAYNDYGSIEDVVKDENTEILENFYCKISIEDIVSGITNRDEGLPKDLQDLSITWIHGDVYKKLARLRGKDSEDNHTAIGAPDLLLYLGFEYKGERKDKNGYDFIFTKDGLTLYSDGERLSASGLYTLETLVRYADAHGASLDPKKIAKLEKLGYYEKIYLYNLSKHNHWLGELMMGDRYDFSLTLKGGKLSHMYLEAAKAGKIKSNFVDWHTVRTYYHALGRPLLPIAYSPQCGAPKQVLHVADAARSIIKKEIKEQELEEMQYATA